MEPKQFLWDRGNSGKTEEEELFFDIKKRIVHPILHSRSEKRYIVLGKTKKKKLLYVVFTQRSKKIRIISARNINKKEVHLYEKSTEHTKI
jgi:uncharacterized DUF497 family protein